MKKLFLLIPVLILLPYGKVIAEWSYLGKNEEAEVYVDNSSINRSGNKVNGWIMQKYFESKITGTRSHITNWVFDCKKETAKVTQTLSYNNQGQQTGDDKPFIGFAQKQEPNTVGYSLMKYMCSAQ